MKKILIMLGVAAFALAIGGCVTTTGVNFDRAKVNGFSIGKTTKAEVVAALGQPRRDQTYTIKKDLADKELASPLIVNELNYYFQDSRGEPAVAGIEPSRSVWFNFSGDKLIGYSISSSFKQDSTDFDHSLIKKIEKGKTTEADLVRLFGQPTGRGMYPLAKEPGGARAIYQVFFYDRTNRKSTMKVFGAYLAPNQVVSDYDLNITVK